MFLTFDFLEDNQYRLSDNSKVAQYIVTQSQRHYTKYIPSIGISYKPRSNILDGLPRE